MRESVRACLIGVVVAAASGCTVLDPHWRPSDTRADTIVYKDQHFVGGLGEAIDRANRLRAHYVHAVSVQSTTRTVIGLSLIPLSASALYLGFASAANSELAAGLGLGAAGLFGAGTQITSTPRQRVYLQGSRALGCAIVATRPLLFTQADIDKLSLAISRISPLTDASMTLATPLAIALEKDNTDARIAMLRSGVEDKIKMYPVAAEDGAQLLDKLKAHRGTHAERRAEASSELGRTQKLIDQAQQIRSRASMLKRSAETAGLDLDRAVEDIATKVSDQLLKTEPDLDSFMVAAGNLGAWGGKFGSVPKIAPQVDKPKGLASGAPSGGGEASESAALKGESAAVLKYLAKDVEQLVIEGNPFESPIRDLQAANRSLADAAQVLADYVTTADELGKLSGKLADCTVAEVDTGFAIFPPDTEISIEPKASTVVTVTEKTGLPSVHVSPADCGGAATVTTEAPGRMITTRITADKDITEDKQCDLVIANAQATDIRTVTIKIKKGAAPAPVPAKPVGSNDSGTLPTTKLAGCDASNYKRFLQADEYDVLRSVGDVKNLQKHLKVGVDGCAGNETRKAIKQYQLANLSKYDADDQTKIKSSDEAAPILVKATQGMLAEDVADSSPQ